MQDMNLCMSQFLYFRYINACGWKADYVSKLFFFNLSILLYPNFSETTSKWNSGNMESEYFFICSSPYCLI